MDRNATAMILLLVASGCVGESGSLGRTEPLTVDGAQFVPEEMPGTDTTGASNDAGAADESAPRVTGIDTAGLTIVPGQSKRFSGRVSKTAITLGARLADSGTGYYRFSVGAKDLASTEGERTWSATTNFQVNVPPGLTQLEFVAFDEQGRPGPQSALDICVLRPYPDNLNACSPKTLPPYLVLSLVWDVAVDLDLRIVTPSGKVIGAKAPTSASATPSGSVVPSKTDGVLERDSNPACALDYLNREDVVWQEKPETGRYKVYANLFDSCGRPASRFVVSLNSRKALDDQSYTIGEQAIAAGEVLTSEASAGQGPGLFVTEFEVR